MSVDAHVSRCAGETLVLSVWNVLVRLGVDVQLSQAEVDDVDHFVATQRRSTD